MKKLTLMTAAPLALGFASGKPKAAATETTVMTGAMPEGFTVPQPQTGGGGKAKYPFADLEVGGMFGVSRTKRQMTTAVNNANDKYSDVSKDAAGKKVRLNVEREFYAVDVDAPTAKSLKGTAFEGAKALVIRKQ